MEIDWQRFVVMRQCLCGARMFIPQSLSHYLQRLFVSTSDGMLTGGQEASVLVKAPANGLIKWRI